MLPDRRLKPRNASFQIRTRTNLRHGQVEIHLEIILRRGRHSPRLGIVKRDLAPIRLAMNFFSLGQQIASGPAPLNVVIGHHRVHDVVSPALRHMAPQAIGRTGVPLRLHQPLKRGAVAIAADFHSRGFGFFPVANIMRIVTTRAGELPIAFTKTGRLPKPVGRMRDLECVVTARARREIEMKHEVRKRFTRLVGERAPAGPAQGVRQTLDSRLQVTLHAHFHLPLQTQPRRVDDAGAHGLRRRRDRA